MSDWNSTLYLKFKKERTQPAADLAARLRTYNPEKIADIGCGPGNSTAVLRSVFPKAELCGIDASQNMIEKARQEHPELKFILCDINDMICFFLMPVFSGFQIISVFCHALCRN